MADTVYQTDPESVYARMIAAQQNQNPSIAGGPADQRPLPWGGTSATPGSAYGSAIGDGQPVIGTYKPGDAFDPKTGIFGTPAPKTDPTSNSDWSTGSWDANRVNQYFQSRGVTPNATSPKYWEDRWNEWGKNDPAYFLKRLSMADEFTGGPQANGSGTPPPNFGDTDPALKNKSNAFYDMLMGRAQQSLVVDPNDPVIKAQTNAFDAQQQRAARNSLQRLGETAGPNANISAETRLANERVGQNDSAYAATLTANEIGARRTEIQNALNGIYGVLTADQSAALQRELTRMSLAERSYEFDTNNQNTLNGF